MSLLQHPDGVDPQALQIWNNAAFDDADADAAPAGSDGSAAKPRWSPLQPISTNRSDWIDLDPSKENRIPASTKSPVSRKSPSATAKKPARMAFKEEARADDVSNIDDEIAEMEKEIERLSSRLHELRTKKAEIDSRAAARRGRIVPAKFMDIKHSTTKNLESSSPLKKVGNSPAPVGVRRRGLSLGPMEISGSRMKLFGQNPSSTKNAATTAMKMIGESPSNAKLLRRVSSIGPLEIRKVDMPEGGTPLKPVQNRRKSVISKLEDIEEEKGPREDSGRRNPKSQPPFFANKDSSALLKGSTTKSVGPKKVPDPRADVLLRRRGVSLGPSEIANSIRSHQRNKLQDIREKELKGDPQRSSSQSPKSRRQSAVKFSDLRRGIATVGAKKPVCRREDDGSSSILRPKALFREDKSTVLVKRPSRSSTKVRVVASRYSLATAIGSGDETESKRRKWSLPEFSRKGSNNVSLAGSCGSIPESPVKQGLDPVAQVKEEGEAIMAISNVEGKEMNSWIGGQSPPSIMKVAEMLPKIKTLRCTTGSPRDSGCAKKVSELVGRRSIFGVEEVEQGISFNQVLTFEEEE